MLINKVFCLNRKNDLFGTLEKAKFISDFILKNIKHIEENNSIALFGKWGSGKSCVIKTIIRNLEKSNKITTFYFNAWKYERDNNIAFSLYEFLTEKASVEEKKKVLKVGYNLLISGLSSININFPLLGIIGLNPEKFVDKYIELIERKKINKSLYKKIQDFENEYKAIINAISQENNNNPLIFFFDDLDRCNPENILKLLSSIKLFFISDKNTTPNLPVIYFFAIDKEAIVKAATLRYSDKNKGEEFLEKIFDISFNMPADYILDGIIRHYFHNCEESIINDLITFFKKIKFTNPRHLKKVLNRYGMVRKIKKTMKGSSYYNIIPNIILENKGDGYLLDTIFTLFFIILFEFNLNKYLEIRKYDEKVFYYKKNISSDDPKSPINLSVRDRIFESSFLFEEKELKCNFKNLKSFLTEQKKGGYKNLFKFMNIFTPRDIKNLSIPINELEPSVSLQFIEQYPNYFIYKNNELLIDFYKYFFENREKYLTEFEKREDVESLKYKISDFFSFVENIL